MGIGVIGMNVTQAFSSSIQSNYLVIPPIQINLVSATLLPVNQQFLRIPESYYEAFSVVEDLLSGQNSHPSC